MTMGRSPRFLTGIADGLLPARLAALDPERAVAHRGRPEAGAAILEARRTAEVASLLPPPAILDPRPGPATPGEERGRIAA